MEPCGAGLTRIGPTLIDRLLVLENQAAHLSVLADVANARRTAAKSPIRSLSEAQRTCRELVGRIDPMLLTHFRHRCLGGFAMHAAELVPLKCSVDLQSEGFDDRRPQRNIGCKRLSECFRS